jgi:hypothetical protein
VSATGPAKHHENRCCSALVPSSSCPYSPNVGEDEFSELRLYRILGSSA